MQQWGLYDEVRTMKFAHFSDIHLGYQKNKSLQQVEQDTFERALDDCIRRSVDFILICGDMFHVNIPEMRVQKFAFSKLRQVYEAGIPVYAVYGSHDYSPLGDSAIDLLAATGYITNVQRMHSNDDDGSISLEFVTDRRTGAKLAGISGLSVSKDIAYYRRLRQHELESEPGFKIFLFHAAVAEMRTADEAAATAEDAMPISYMPRNFGYYAGGHMHRYAYKRFGDHPHVVYPGTTFAGYHSDLEDNAGDIARGYVLVECDDATKRVTDVRQVSIPNCEYHVIRVDASNRDSDAVNDDLMQKVGRAEPADKVVIIVISGKMSRGKTTDVNVGRAADRLRRGGAIDVLTRRNRLMSAEYDIARAPGGTADEIARSTFEENIGQIDPKTYPELGGRKGVALAERLLEGLGRPQLENEPVGAYQKRIVGEAMALLGLDKDDSDSDDGGDSDNDGAEAADVNRNDHDTDRPDATAKNGGQKGAERRQQ